MIDIHTHILPGVDDGPSTEREAMEMAEVAAASGIKVLAATPHHKNGRWMNKAEDIEARVNRLNDRLKKEKMDLLIVPGQETRIHGEMLEGLGRGELLTINYSSYLLVELPFEDIPYYTDKLLYHVMLAGYKPIIVHPERNLVIQKRPEQLALYVRQGMLTQVTSGSFLGGFGKAARNTAHYLMKAGLTHLIASDAHTSNIDYRGFDLKKTYGVIGKKYGEEQVTFLKNNAECVVADQTIVVHPPVFEKRKRFVFF